MCCDIIASSWLRSDLVAGLVLTAVLVPVGMGYAEAAGLPAINGLYATIVPLLVYAIFGPSRILVLGPDSSLAAVIAAVIVPLAAGDPDRTIALAGMLAIFTGLLCILAGLARLGFITELLSKPIRYGYMNGIALIVLVGQLPKLFGFSVEGNGVLAGSGCFYPGCAGREDQLGHPGVGAATLVFILAFKRYQAIPRRAGGGGGSNGRDGCLRPGQPGWGIGSGHASSGIALLYHSMDSPGGSWPAAGWGDRHLRWFLLPIPACSRAAWLPGAAHMWTRTRR